MTVELSIAEARRLALAAQGLLAPTARCGGAVDRVVGVVGQLGAVQLDTISVLARSHELVAFARAGAVGRRAVERAYWGAPHRCIEYWSHAACVVPLEDWPWYAWRRRRSRRRYLAGRENAPAFVEVRQRLRDLGPITTEGLGGARQGGPWWDWSPLKVAVEELLAAGEVVCQERRGWRRVYDLPERALAAALRAHEPDDAECHRHLLAGAARRLGVATLADLADYPRLPLRDARAALPGMGLTEVRVQGWAQPAWADPALLEGLSGGQLGGRCRSVLLSPFDSLIWDRRRTGRLFDFAHRLEAYTPASQREHGYFTMPLLAGGRLRGRVDPKRAGATLVARQVGVEAGAEAAMATALVAAARWVGCERVVAERVRPEGRGPRLRELLTRAQSGDHARDLRIGS
ncbi:MAG TPA: crosslink repair DNA glycosylase YcaQ family protein [Candidatus Dormibacteraeota bacterium]